LSIAIRNPETLSHTYLFDEGCVRTRLDELTRAFISKFETEAMQRIVDKAKRNFEPIPTFNFIQSELEQKYGERAKEEAQKILEQERQLFINSRTETIKKALTQIIQRLRFLVYAVDSEGKPYKLQIFMEKIAHYNSNGTVSFPQELYVGDRDFERAKDILNTSARLKEFELYLPYFSEELKDFWNEATELGNLEWVDKDKEKEEEKHAKKTD